ncbi:inositol polyphosphate 1-phosphatase isoform X1 [Leptidea sinapis]|uniref:inositol polyphosphate 1-phosphatase isoform X1 n=1 Tax=Leptidea sinapis TaxID=189913 RepID=UPI00212E507B|nr:inositol polyphosphate 1-phosphatase isoform X1 [Leptidea sinapis]XP_050664472.1 inositol polyphosphate 1-phosphatase isoform X1 [Leptidea sinapis]
MANILDTLICASEKAASIARSCCESNCSESLLVVEKGDSEANVRFNKDYKTIADVLAQETAKSFIVSQFPSLLNDVRGEECSEIGGLTISIQDSVEKTTNLLSSLVPEGMARCMANAAHDEVHSPCDKEYYPDITTLDYSDLGIWIDPIDATAEFIAGVCGNAAPGFGLDCVTVLIGAYLKSTGQPVIGVVNQPFYDSGKGRIIWGVSYGDIQKCSVDVVSYDDNKIILTSSFEHEDTLKKFRDEGWQIQSVPGAGNKMIKVALGEAAAYFVSKGTFRWDTCAPHGIIRSLGGDVTSYKNYRTITYNDAKELPTQKYCNNDGVVAFTKQSVFDEIKSILET